MISLPTRSLPFTAVANRSLPGWVTVVIVVVHPRFTVYSQEKVTNRIKLLVTSTKREQPVKIVTAVKPTEVPTPSISGVTKEKRVRVLNKVKAVGTINRKIASTSKSRAVAVESIEKEKTAP